MFPSIMFQLKTKQSSDEILKAFRASGIATRDFEIRPSGNRYCYFVYKTDSIEKTKEFVINAAARIEAIQDGDTEFCYDDGEGRSYHVSEGALVSDDDCRSLDRTSWINLEHLTGIKDNLEKAVKIWAKETGASREDTTAKLEALKRSKQAWDEDIERSSNRPQKPKRDPNTSSPFQEEANPISPTVNTSLSIDSIVQTVALINNSSRAYIPFLVCAADISPGLSRKDFLSLARRFDVSARRATVYQQLKKELGEESRSTQ